MAEVGLALAIDLSGTKGDRNRRRLHGYTHKQFVKVALPPLAALGCVGASNAVDEFEHPHDGHRVTNTTTPKALLPVGF